MKKLSVLLLPYAAVGVGMIWLNSAWLAIGLYHAGIIAFICFSQPEGWRQKLFAGFRASYAWPGMLVCALSTPIIRYCWPWFVASDITLQDWMSAFGLEGWAWWLLIPWFSLVHPILEELYWRSLSREPFRWFNIKDFVFAGYHLLVLHRLIRSPWLVLIFFVLVAASVFWRWAAARFGGYATGILTHAVADAAVIGGVLWG